MSLQHILVAYDESDGSHEALLLAADLASQNPQMKVDIVYVVPIPLLDQKQEESFRDILDMMISDGEDLLADAIEKLGSPIDAQFDSLLLSGTSPATEILKLLEERPDYDLIIVGNRGLTGRREMMGSVSLKILNGAHIPVLIVK